MGISGFLSSAAGESDLLSSCSRNSEFLSSCCWKWGFLWSCMGTQSSSPIAAGNQCSSGVPVWDAGCHWSHGGKLGVLKLHWYSGFLLIHNGTSCRVPLGQLASSRDVQGGSYLVAVTGGCSLVLARDYSLLGPGQLCSCGGFNSL